MAGEAGCFDPAARAKVARNAIQGLIGLNVALEPQLLTCSPICPYSRDIEHVCGVRIEVGGDAVSAFGSFLTAHRHTVEGHG
jgi:hypothetical protein